MKTSINGINLIKQSEGCRLTAYQDSIGVWTIGYGHTGKVDGKSICKCMKITLDKAVELLKEDLTKFEKSVAKYNSKYSWNQNEFDSLVCFALNVGSIDGLTDEGTRTKDIIKDKILLYNKADGKALDGLTKRRVAERNLFITQMKNSTDSVKTSNTSSTITYTVKKGDSLSAIADKYNTTVEKIVMNNNIKNASIIQIGQKLKL